MSRNLQVTPVRRMVLHELGVDYNIRNGVGAQRLRSNRTEDLSPFVQAILDPLKVISEFCLHGPVVAYDYDANIRCRLNLGAEWNLQSPRRMCAPIHIRPPTSSCIRCAIVADSSMTLSV